MALQRVGTRRPRVIQRSRGDIRDYGRPRSIQRQDLTLSTDATPFGCCDFFSRCADEIMSLHYSGNLGLLDWMGFEVAEECKRTLDYITFVRPEYLTQEVTSGYISDPCADPNGIEYGARSLTVEDFGLYGREGPVRDIRKGNLRYCKTDPRRRLDGTLVTDEREWDMRFITDVLLQDIRRDLVVGNAAVAGQFDGLQQWVSTNHGGALNSIVIDWNNNAMAGGAGITWNGAAVGAAYDIIDVLRAVVRRIRERISWSPVLNAQPLNVGDMILVLPTFMANCLLDFFTCWSVCTGEQYNEVMLQSYEARQFRDGLNGGPFGDGIITIDGQAIPLMTYDWNMINGPTRGDMYLLTGSVGSVRLWEGEFLGADDAVNQVQEEGSYFSTDGGRILGKVDVDNLCKIMKLWMSVRLFNRAPWAQARFQDVVCRWPGGPLSPDPTETSFYPETSFDQAACS